METMTRDDVKERILTIAHEIRALAASSYGPRGRVKVLVPNDDAWDDATVTSTAMRILDRIGTADCPIASVYLHLLKSSIRLQNDAGLYTMLLSAELLLMATDGCLADTPQRLVAQGYQLGLEWCMAYLEDPACPVVTQVDWSDSVAVYGVLRGCLHSKPLLSTFESTLGAKTVLSLLVEAFVSVLQYVLNHPGDPIPIRYHHERRFAATTNSTRVLQNTILVDRSMDSTLSRHLPMSDVMVMMFSITVGPQHDEDNGAVSVDSDCGGLPLRGLPHDMALKSIGDKIVASGARVVFSQKLIPEYLVHYLSSYGVIAFERLGTTHMRAVQLLTGSVPLGDWRVLDDLKTVQRCMGQLSHISRIEIDQKDHIQLIQSRSTVERGLKVWPVTTLVINVATERVYSELVHSISSTFNLLTKSMEHSDVVAGAGCMEIHLASWLRRNAEQFVIDRTNPGSTTRPLSSDLKAVRHLRTTISAFADAVESVAARLDHGINGGGEEIIEQLRDANRITCGVLSDVTHYSLYGWDPNKGSPTVVIRKTAQPDENSSNSSSSGRSDDSSDGEDDEDGNQQWQLVDASILDSLAAKTHALSSAVACATSLMRIAGVIHPTAAP